MTNKTSGDCVICEDPEMICPQHTLDMATYNDPNSIFKGLTGDAQEAVVVHQLKETLFMAYELQSFEGTMFCEEGDDDLILACHTLIEYYGMPDVDFKKGE